MKTITYNEQTHRLVPVEPTESMAAAGWDDAIEHEADNVDIYDIAAIYRVMLSAAPKPEPVDVEPVAWAMRHLSSGTIYTARPNQKAIHPHIWSDAFPLYTAPPDYEAVKKQRDEYRKDAERYRFLREQRWSESNMCVVLHPKNAVRLGHECPAVERLDAYVDAAIASVKGGV